MARALFPFFCFPSAAAEKLVGPAISTVAVLALRAVLKNGHGLEIAHQQIRYEGLDLAFSSRVTASGDLVLEVDIGNPKLGERIVLEADLRRETRRIVSIR